MHNTEREEIKQKILKRIEDKETFTVRELYDGLGNKGRKIADNVLQVLRKQGKIDYYKSARQYVWFKVKG